MHLRKRDIGERDMGERDMGERDMGERDMGERDIGERDMGERDIGERDIGERDIRERDIGERDIGERDIGEGDIRKRDIRDRDAGRLSPPANSPSSCCSTLTSEVFPAASASCRVSAAARGFGGITSPKNSSLLRVWVSGVQGRGRGSGVSGRRLWPWGMLPHLLALLR